MAETRKPNIKRPKNIKRPVAKRAPGVNRPEYPTGSNSPRQAANEAGVSHGKLYVRMLNCSGLVVPVVAELVCDRMQDGYRFIEGEPCIPRFHGNPRVCDATHEDPKFRPYPRQQPHPGSTAEAIRVWHQFAHKDRTVYADTFGLSWDFIANLAGRLNERNPLAVHMDAENPDSSRNPFINRQP